MSISRPVESFTKSPQQSQKHIHLPMSFSTLDKSRMWFVQPRWMPGINRANCPTGCYLEITSWRWMILVSVTWWHVNWRGKTFWNGLGCFGIVEKWKPMENPPKMAWLHLGDFRPKAAVFLGVNGVTISCLAATFPAASEVEIAIPRTTNSQSGDASGNSGHYPTSHCHRM